jgi:hypothetical protein
MFKLNCLNQNLRINEKRWDRGANQDGECQSQKIEQNWAWPNLT